MPKRSMRVKPSMNIMHCCSDSHIGSQVPLRVTSYNEAGSEVILLVSVLGCGSSEILKIVDDAFLPDHRLVIGVQPTYETVYRYATNSKAKALTLPLTNTFDVDMKAIIRATRLNARDVGFRVHL
jgi:histidinol-phosphate/aromatic aminotransferase/cobyric acid decarboxylase-like protein